MLNNTTKLDKFLAFMVALPAVALLFFAIYAIEAVIFRLLWNWLIVDIFKLRSIGFIEAAGLVVLCLLVFGSRLKNKTE